MKAVHSILLKHSLFLMAMATPFLIQAQEKKVALGLGVSPTINWLSTSSGYLENDGSQLGFSYGLVADFNFGENYAFATGFYINHRGGSTKSYEFNPTGYDIITTQYDIQTLMIPITLRMRTKEIGYLKYYGQFGFNPEVALNASADIHSSEGTDQNNVGVMSHVVDMNLSLTLGAGVEYNISGTTNILIGLSYSNGFVDMLKGSTGGLIPVEKRATTNQIALNLAVLF